MIKQINSIDISQLDLPAISSDRNLSIQGDDGAEFLLQIFNSSQQFYNFVTRSFSSNSNSESIVKGSINGSSYNTLIKFPASGVTTYTILVIIPLDKNTEFGYTSKKSDSLTIKQVADGVLTFTPLSSTSTKYGSMPSNITSTSSPTSAFSVLKSLNWDLPGANNDTHGFGLRLIRQPIDTDWYFEKDLNILSNPLGDAVSGNTVIVADLTDIAIGMELIFHKGTTAPAATTIIIDIDETFKKITFSTSTAFEDGETMKFRAKGSNVIKEAIGADIDFSSFNAETISATSAILKQEARSDAVSTTITLIDTYGVSGGGFVTIQGTGIINTGTNAIQTVTADAGGGGGDGLMVMQIAQDVAQKTVITFTGSTQTVSVVNTFTINSHPSANKTIYLNLDNFITPGVSGS